MWHQYGEPEQVRVMGLYDISMGDLNKSKGVV